MARLIDADALMKNVGKIPQLRGITYGRMKKAVEETPTIDAEPVRHAKYIHVGPSFKGGVDWYRCSNCGALESGVYVQHPFCSICGAKMDGGAE